MSQENIDSSKDQTNTRDDNDGDISASQSLQQVPISESETKIDGSVRSTSNINNANKNKRLSFKNGKAEVQEYEKSSEGEETPNNPSATNFVRGREQSDGAISNGPAMSEGGRSVQSEATRNMIRNREMSEGAVSNGPAMSEGRPSVAASQRAGNVVRGREMSEGAMSYGPAMSEGGRSVAESQATARNMAQPVSRQMSEGAASMAQPMSRQMSEGAASMAQPMSRQMSEGTASMAQPMGRQMSEGAASMAQPMSRQMSEGVQNGMNSRSAEIKGGQSSAQDRAEFGYFNGGFSEAKSTLSVPLDATDETFEEPPPLLGTGSTLESTSNYSNWPFMPIGPPFADEALVPQLESLYNQQNAAINVNRDQIPAVAETKEDKEWISKFERFTVKFLNKIFRRAQHERKLKAAVQNPESCKNSNMNPTGQQLNPYYSYPQNPPPSAAVPIQQDGGSMYPPPLPLQALPPYQTNNAGNQQQGPSEEEEEAAVVAELNAMLDDISQDVNTISPEYLTLVTPLFGTLVELKGKDFRKTDNRDIFHKVDDYHALIKCDTHICLESVMSRLQALVDFINVIMADSENLKKFPRIITKCYETDSKICQEVCEVYSDDDFQTVNIKKMCKLKPKPPERPPWRLTYKIGDECFGSGKVKANTCSSPAPEKTCGLTGPAKFSGGRTKSCGSKLRSESTCYSPCCSSLGSRAAIRRYRSLSLNRPCPCGCCDSTDEIPNICVIYFTRFRDVKEEDCPMVLEGLPTNEIFPSITNFDNKRQLNIPSQRLFLQEPKCYNPPPVPDHCFGGKGHRWKKKFPCGARNACCKESCKSQRDPRSCCNKGSKRRRRRSCIKKMRKCSALAECQTSEIQLQPMPPPGGGGTAGVGGVGDMSTLTPGEFNAKMVDMFGRAVEEGERALGQGTRSKEVADLARGLFGRERGSAPGKPYGYNMSGMVATQTMQKPGSRQNQAQQQPSPSQQNYIVQMMHAMQLDDSRGGKCCSGQQTLMFPEKSTCRSTRSCQNKQAQTFQPRSSDVKSRNMLSSKFSMNIQCSESKAPAMGNSSYQSCRPSARQSANHNQESFSGLQRNLQMSNNQLAGMLARLMLPPRTPESSSQQVFTNFIAQMYAAGNISRNDATRMAGLISNGFPLNRAEPEEGGSGGGGGGGGPSQRSIRPQSATKGAQCTISQIQQMTTSQVQLNCAPSTRSTKTVHYCGPEDGCPSIKESAASQSLFTTTQVYTTASGTQLQHTRSLHAPDGSYSQSMLCVSTSKPSIQGMQRCGTQNKPVCLTKSKPSMMGVPRCKSMQSKKNVCVTKSQPSCPGIPRCPTSTKSKPSCVTKSKPSMAGVPRCKSKKPVCVTKSQPSQPGLPRCVPAVPLDGPITDGEPDDDDGTGGEPPTEDGPPQEDENVPNDGGDGGPPSDGEGGEPPSDVENVPENDEPPPGDEMQVVGDEEEEREEEGEDSPRKSSVLTPKSDKSPPKSEHNTAPSGGTPPLSDTPSPQGSPVLSSHTVSSPVRSPVSERSQSLSSRSPSLPPNEEEETTEEEEELEWPSTPPRGPLEKRPSTPPEPPSPPPRKSKPGKNYHSPFKFNKVRVPDPPCETVLCDLPDCHPLKTPYPPQYRFDEVRMRRYMEQCHQLKKICSHPPGEQCWTPPPPPLPPELREKKPPFPPDRCHPPLFPGTNLGMGCSYGLPSGNCYGQYEKGLKKPEDCFFDCGGICPMGLLGEACPQQPPPYSKLKKKQKKDEVFQFDYITVMREKTAPPEQEEYCDQLKRSRREQELQLMEAMAAAEQCVVEDPSCNPRRGKHGRRRKSKGGACVDGIDPEGPPPPSHEIARFLNRRDVQVVKEQKTEIVKKQGMEGQERLVTQMEAYYTKTPDGKIATELKDAGNNNNSSKANTVDQWMKQDANATLRKHNRGLKTTDECPVLRTDWEKEFKEFAKSCGRSKSKGRQKPLPPGFIPCPLPEATTIMCRVPDPNSLTPGGNNVLQCQAIPIPTGNVGGNNAMQFGTEGVCVGGGGRGANGMAGLSFMAPPGGYGGYVHQQPLQQQTNQMFAQGLPPPPVPPQQMYQTLMSGFPQGVLPPPASSAPQQYQAYPQQMYSQPQNIGQVGSQPQQQQYQQQLYSQSKPLSQVGSQPQPQQQIYSQSQPLSQVGSQPQQQQYQQQTYSQSQPLGQVGSQPQQQRMQWDADSPPPPPNGYDRFAPNQPVFGPVRATSNNSQGERRKSLDAPPPPAPAQLQPENASDYPYMCEIRYHEPIHGSIYGRVVTRKQPCRLIDPNMVIPPGHNPNCPVLMTTPFFNPSCRQRNPPQEEQSQEPRNNNNL